MDSYERLESDYLVLQRQYNTLKASHTKLMEYANHKKDCLKGLRIPLSGNYEPCTCGLEQAIEEAGKI